MWILGNSKELSEKILNLRISTLPKASIRLIFVPFIQLFLINTEKQTHKYYTKLLLFSKTVTADSKY